MITKLVCNRQVATTSLFQAVSVEYTNIKTMLSRRYSIYSTGLYGYSVLQPTYDSWVAPCCTHSGNSLVLDSRSGAMYTSQPAVVYSPQAPPAPAQAYSSKPGLNSKRLSRCEFPCQPFIHVGEPGGLKSWDD